MIRKAVQIDARILKEMQEEKELTGISIFRLFEKAWNEYKKAKEINNDKN